MELIVLGTSEYQWAVNIFAKLFARHWGPQTVTWWGDRCDEKKLAFNVEFRRVPCYAEGVWPWTPWFSNGLLSILDELEGEIFAMFLPDHWLAQDVDLGAVDALREFMAREPGCLRGNLTAGTCMDGYGKHHAVVDGREIVSVRPDNAHCGLHGGITFCPSLWNKGLLRAAIGERHWSLWQTESEGTKWLVRRSPEIFSAGLRPGPVVRCHGLYHERQNVADFTGLSEADFQEVKHWVPSGWKIERHV